MLSLSWKVLFSKSRDNFLHLDFRDPSPSCPVFNIKAHQVQTPPTYFSLSKIHIPYMIEVVTLHPLSQCDDCWKISIENLISQVSTLLSIYFLNHTTLQIFFSITHLSRLPILLAIASMQCIFSLTSFFFISLLSVSHSCDQLAISICQLNYSWGAYEVQDLCISSNRKMYSHRAFCIVFLLFSLTFKHS